MSSRRRVPLIAVLLTGIAIACGTGGGGSLPDGSTSNSTSDASPADASVGDSRTADSGTAGGGSIAASEFDQACQVDGDCVVVYQGTVCNSCRCENAAIAKKELDRYRSELDARSANCGQIPGCAADCAAPNPYCVSGSCVASVKPPDAG